MLPRGMLLALLVLVLGHLPAFGQAPAKITIGTGTAVDFLPAFVARDTGIFAKHGLDATLTIIAVPSLVPPALVSGSLQIGELTPPNIILAEAGGIELVAIAGTTRLVATHPKIALVTRAGVTVNEAQDLVGKKVGVPGFDSIIDWFLRHWLIEHRVHLGSRLDRRETPMPQMGDLLKSGQLDAAAPVEPMLSRIIASGAATRSADFFSQANPDTIGTFWGATRAWATANRPLISTLSAPRSPTRSPSSVSIPIRPRRSSRRRWAPSTPSCRNSRRRSSPAILTSSSSSAISSACCTRRSTCRS